MTNDKYDWHEWYAWKPVKINDEWVWNKTVYRRWNPMQGGFTYGTIFDVMTKPKKQLRAIIEIGTDLFVPRTKK